MKALKENIVFTVNPSLEFIYAINFVANKEALYKFYSDFNFVPTEEFKQTVEEMAGNLSRYIQSELKFFFQWEPVKHTLGRILERHSDIDSVSAFIALIEQMHENELLFYLANQALYGINSDIELNWNKNDDMIARITANITDMDEDSTVDKERLMECIENPMEIKSRLILLLKQFYEKSYKPVEVQILRELEQAKSRYERLFRDEYTFFEDEYLKALQNSAFANLIIHISYFIQIRVWSFDIKPYKDIQWISLGIYSEFYPRKKFIKAKVQNFIKILSDKKRFEMIELLSKKPHYVYELAAELELTSPTVCYHLNYMVDLNLVSLERENTKTYYTLNKEMVRELLCNASAILLDEK